MSLGFRDFVCGAEADRPLLERICRAYSLAVEEGRKRPLRYRPTTWWEEQRKLTLGPVMRALAAHDLNALQTMYGNFFRDDCAMGLVPVQRMRSRYFGESISTFRQHLYLIDALYRLEYWRERTGERYEICELAGPETGNPFGVVLDGTLVRTGSEYQHYCAQRIMGIQEEGRAAIAEIGGGYGGMAYYLLRDRPQTTYLNFDVPESIALASYYLLKSFPEKKAILYGEEELTADGLGRAEIVLLPVFELEQMPEDVADLCFSSHALSDVAREVMPGYLADLARLTRGHFLYIGNCRLARMIEERDPGDELFAPMESRASDWHRHVASAADDGEFLYRILRSGRGESGHA